MKNTFREGSKSYSIMESINKGDTYDKIVDTMKLKGKHDIYIAVSKNRKNIKLKNLQKKATSPIEEKAETEEENSASENAPKSSAEMIEMKNRIDKLSEIVTNFTGNEGKPLYSPSPTSEPMGSQKRMEVTVEPSMKQIGTWVYAKNLLFFDFARGGSFEGALKNFSGNWSDFINIILESYFKDKFGSEIGLMSRRYLP